MANYLLLAMIVLLSSACTYNSKTGKTKFTPFGAGVHEMAETVYQDTKECARPDSHCETLTGHDDYDASKVRAMSNEEFEEYVAKQRKR